MSLINVNKIDPATGTALEIGTSGDTITVPSGATFNVAGTLQSGGAALVTGKILQVEQVDRAGNQTQTINSSSTWVALTDMEDTITTSSGSSVLIMLDINCYFDNNIGYSARVTFNHSGISETDVYVDAITNTAMLFNGITRVNTNNTLIIKHSPSTTNEITYKAYARNSGESYFSSTRQNSLTLMEIGS